MKTKIPLAALLVLLLSGCSAITDAFTPGSGTTAQSAASLPDQQATTNSIEMNRFPQTAETSNSRPRP